MKDYFHRLLCYFSVSRPREAQLCFGDFSDYFIAFESGTIYKYFPQIIPERCFTNERKANPLLQFPLGSFQHAAYVRMLCIWILYEDEVPSNIDNPRYVHSNLPYMLGLALDAHIHIVLNSSCNNIRYMYRHRLAPEHYLLSSKSKTLPFLWSQEMVSESRVQETMEMLWNQEITIAFGSRRVIQTVLRPQDFKTQQAKITHRDITLLKKGMPRPTSIRYIATQINKGLQQCPHVVQNAAAHGIPMQYPCVLIMLMCNYLGAYKHAVSIASPDHRLLLYAQNNVTDILQLVSKTMNNNHLYNIIAEFIVAWSEDTSHLAYLLRRTDFWQVHRDFVIWNCNFILPMIRKTYSGNIPKNMRTRCNASQPLKKALMHPYESKCNKNLMFFLFKALMVRKRISKNSYKILRKHKIQTARVYKLAIKRISYFGLDGSILRDMGMQPSTIDKLQVDLNDKSTGRMSKIVSTAIQNIGSRVDITLLHLYLHALKEKSQFVIAGIFQSPSATAPSCTTMLCLSCMSIRSKAKGEKTIGAKCSGISIDIISNVAYCSSCNSRDIMPIDLTNRVIQSSKTGSERTHHRLATCNGCHHPVYIKLCRFIGESIYCKDCFGVKQKSEATHLICGCQLHSYRNKNKIAYSRVIAFDMERDKYIETFVCNQHLSLISPGVHSINTLKVLFSSRHFTSSR